MRSRSLISVFVCLVSVALSAQEQPKFRTDARLVLVPAVVKDKSGNHLSGLTKEQFKLTQDGKEQAIGVFEEVKVSKLRLEPVQTAPRKVMRDPTNIPSGV